MPRPERKHMPCEIKMLHSKTIDKWKSSQVVSAINKELVGRNVAAWIDSGIDPDHPWEVGFGVINSFLPMTERINWNRNVSIIISAKICNKTKTFCKMSEPYTVKVFLTSNNYGTCWCLLEAVEDVEESSEDSISSSTTSSESSSSDDNESSFSKFLPSN